MGVRLFGPLMEYLSIWGHLIGIRGIRMFNGVVGGILGVLVIDGVVGVTLWAPEIWGH